MQRSGLSSCYEIPIFGDFTQRIITGRRQIGWTIPSQKKGKEWFMLPKCPELFKFVFDKSELIMAFWYIMSLVALLMPHRLWLGVYEESSQKD